MPLAISWLASLSSTTRICLFLIIAISWVLCELINPDCALNSALRILSRSMPMTGFITTWSQASSCVSCARLFSKVSNMRNLDRSSNRNSLSSIDSSMIATSYCAFESSMTSRPSSPSCCSKPVFWIEFLVSKRTLLIVPRCRVSTAESIELCLNGNSKQNSLPLPATDSTEIGPPHDLYQAFANGKPEPRAIIFCR